MAGAGTRTRKDGTPSAKVGSIEVLRPKMIGPAIPRKQQVRAMGTAAASAERFAKTPAQKAEAAGLRAKAESAARARAAFLEARKASRAAPKADAAPAPASKAKVPREPTKRTSLGAMHVKERHERVQERTWYAMQRHVERDATTQALKEKWEKVERRAHMNFKDRETERKAIANADKAYDALKAHRTKMEEQWAKENPKEARLHEIARRGGDRARVAEARLTRGERRQSEKRAEERYKAEAPARAKAAAEAAVREKAAAEQRVKDVAFLAARAKRHGIGFKEEGGDLLVESHNGTMRRHVFSDEAKRTMRETIRQKASNVRNERKREAAEAKAVADRRAEIQKARAEIAAAPAAPKGYFNLRAYHNGVGAASVRPVKALAQAGDVAAHKPLNGKGYDITHKPTGLRITQADTAAEAKHFVAGLSTPHMTSLLSRAAAGDHKAAMEGSEHATRLKQEAKAMAAGPRWRPPARPVHAELRAAEQKAAEAMESAKGQGAAAAKAARQAHRLAVARRSAAEADMARHQAA